MQSDVHLIFLPWKHVGREITWSHFSNKTLVELVYFIFIIFNNIFWDYLVMTSFIDWNKVSCQQMQLQRNIIILSFASITCSLLKKCYSNLIAVYNDLLNSSHYQFFYSSKQLGHFPIKIVHQKFFMFPDTYKLSYQSS